MVNVRTVNNEEELKREFDSIKNVLNNCKKPITIMWGFKKIMLSETNYSR